MPRVALVVLAFLGLAMPPALSAPGAPMVVAVSVTGNAHVPTDRILAVVSTKVGDPFDPAKVQADLRAIADLGFFAGQAPPLIKQRPDGIAVTFRVIENPVVTSIRFDGNKTVSADTLLALMDTAPGQVFNIKTYQQDVIKINSYYDNVGFGGQLPTHVADVNIARNGVLTLKIQEGLTVRHIIITPPPDADPVLPPNVIAAVLSTKPGGPYSEDSRDKDYDAIKTLYAKFDLKVGDVQAGVDPSTIDQKAGTADVRYTISVMRVGSIEITGNTKTHDDVIRRQLRLLPGDVVTDAALRNDYERLNNLGFFDKVDFQAKPGPDPKRPGLVTLNWQVKEQRTGTATLGAGYSGGVTGYGLTGTLSYQENNINGTGNSASVRFERGAQIADEQISFTIPYLGKTEQSQKYSLATTLFAQQTLNFYPVYGACGTTYGYTNPCPTTGPYPISIIPANAANYNLINGVYADYSSKDEGISTTLGRRLSDYTRLTLGGNIQEVSATATAPSGYYFPTNQNILTGDICATSSLLSSSCGSLNNAYGLTASSIAQENSGQLYNLRSIVAGIAFDTRDDVFNPRRGYTASVTDEFSSTAMGSSWNYTILTVDAAKFFPVGKNQTLGVHVREGSSTGTIPVNKLFILDDQELRGYQTPFYGTDMLLGQVELRIPLSADRKFQIVTFADAGATRIRGGTSSDGTNIYDLNSFQFHGDVGVGLRFDLPALGLRTLRLDFAKGSEGMHTSFGIGQSF
jgi:outer membrane protein assembly complex protein YaeT